MLSKNKHLTLQQLNRKKQNMKKKVFISAMLTLNFAFASLNSFSQANGGFENWSMVYGLLEPNNWQTFNFLSLTTPPNPLSAFKATGIDKHSGNYALKLQTVYLNNNPDPGVLRDTTSGIFTGKINISPFRYDYGFPYTGRPQILEFWAKASPIGNDYGAAFVVLLKWNGVKRDTIAASSVNIRASNSYTLFQDTLTYFSTEIPDSAAIAFTPSRWPNLARVGSTIFVDDVAFIFPAGISEPNIFADKVNLFPNPAKDNITIHAEINEAGNVLIIDASGKQAGIYKIQNYTAEINTSAFAEGIYCCEIRDKKNTTLTKAKFTVIK